MTDPKPSRDEWLKGYTANADIELAWNSMAVGVPRDIYLFMEALRAIAMTPDKTPAVSDKCRGVVSKPEEGGCDD